MIKNFIKQILIVFFSFIFLCFKAQHAEQSVNSWIIFVNSSDFSDSFKNELSKQLRESLFTLINLSENSENPVTLAIGLEKTEYQPLNGGLSINASIISREDGSSYPVTINWKSDSFSDVRKIQKSDISGKQVIFKWGDDFPKKELIEIITREKIYEVTNGLHYIINPIYYPDLSVILKTEKELSLPEAKIIENIFKVRKDVYVSELSDNFIMLDFQINSLNFTDNVYKKDLLYLKECIDKISKLDFAGKIKSVEIK